MEDERQAAWENVASEMLYSMGGRLMMSDKNPNKIVIYPLQRGEGNKATWVVAMSEDLLAAFYGAIEGVKNGKATTGMCTVEEVAAKIQVMSGPSNA